MTSFVEELDKSIETHKPGHGLSAIQRGWLSFCIMGVIVTNSVCWAKFERAGLGRYSMAALCWVFRHAKIPWQMLLYRSVCVILARYGITEGFLLIDDTDKRRSKSRISHVHKIKDKATGGFVMGQEIVFLVLATSKITFPVGFAFYMPDPALSSWYRKKKQLAKGGMGPLARKPAPNEHYPTKQPIALGLLGEFKENHPEILVRCVVADALYGSRHFVRAATQTLCSGDQPAQIRSEHPIQE